MNKWAQKKFLFALLTGINCVGSACYSNESQAPGTVVDQTPNRLALLVGINEYRDSNIRSLRGALNDVERMKATLIGKFDFPAENVLALSNHEANRKGILEAFRSHLIDKARDESDIVVFFFSGHGSRVIDENGDEVADNLDETLVPWDSTNSGDRDITDDEINALIKELSTKTKNITLIFDSCSSGTAARGSGALRRIERFADRPGESNKGSAYKEPELDYTLIAAAQSNELAREFVHNDVPYGALTYFLTGQLDSLTSDEVTYGDVMDVVQRKVKALHHNQTPTLEGASADSIIFGDRRIMQQKSVLVIPADSKTVVYLDAGQVHGITKGSVFEIYPPRTRVFEPPSEPLTKAIITEVQSTRSMAKLYAPVTVARGSRAVQREHKYEERKLLISINDDDTSKAMISIAEKLKEYYFVDIVNYKPYHLLIEQKGKKIRLEAADSGVFAAIEADGPNADTRIVEMVTDWGKWFNVLSIENPNPPKKVAIHFSIEAQSTRGGRRSPFAFVGQPDSEVFSGETVILNIESRSTRDLYLHIVNLSTDGTVELIPLDRNNDEDLLKRGRSAILEFEACLPHGYKSVTDVVKIIAHTERLDFEFLEQRPITRSAPRQIETDDPVEALLANIALGSNNPERAIPLDKWISVQRVLKISEPHDGSGLLCE